MASCTVATPKRESCSMAARSARAMLRFTMPRLFVLITRSVVSPEGSRGRSAHQPDAAFQQRIQPREDPARIRLVDLLAVVVAEQLRGLDVALGVVVVI